MSKTYKTFLEWLQDQPEEAQKRLDTLSASVGWYQALLHSEHVKQLEASHRIKMENGNQPVNAQLLDFAKWVLSLNTGGLIEGKARAAIAAAEQKPPASEPVAWTNPELDHLAEEAECVAMCLNDRGVPTHDGSKSLSLWGRVEQYANPRFLEGMRTCPPRVSREHIEVLARVCKIIPQYSTKEYNDAIIGFAYVLFADPSVQESFVRENSHLLYATPQPAVPDGYAHIPYATPCELTTVELRAFKLGWLECEAAHQAMFAAAKGE